jgi:hypothetical protein
MRNLTCERKSTFLSIPTSGHTLSVLVAQCSDPVTCENYFLWVHNQYHGSQKAYSWWRYWITADLWYWFGWEHLIIRYVIISVTSNFLLMTHHILPFSGEHKNSIYALWYKFLCSLCITHWANRVCLWYKNKNGWIQNKFSNFKFPDS